MKLFNGDNTEKFLKDMDLKLLGELPMLNSINNLGQYDNAQIDESLELIFDPIVKNIISELE